MLPSDLFLVGDSLGMVVQGHETTLNVSLDEMAYHCEVVARARPRALVVGDLPFGTYQASAEQAVMLSFSLDIATLGSKPNTFPDVRVAAAVRDDASALRWAQALGASGQLLSRERLSSSFTAIAGQYDWRAQASWPGGTP